MVDLDPGMAPFHGAVPVEFNTLPPPSWDQVRVSNVYDPIMGTIVPQWGLGYPQDYGDILTNWAMEDHTPSITSEAENSPISGVSQDYTEQLAISPEEFHGLWPTGDIWGGPRDDGRGDHL